MNILAINTAFSEAHLALEIGNKQYFSSLDSNCKHSENVLAQIDALCQSAKVDVLDVDTLAVVVGPGSFTGLRIGVAIARALGCVNKNLRFVAISSLELLAFCAQKQHKIQQNFACAINALSNLCFVAYFDTNGIILYEEKLLPLQQLIEQPLPKFVLKGDFPLQIGTELTLCPQMLLEFARNLASSGKFVALENLLPKYIRLSQAEDNLKKKNRQ